MNLQNTMNLGVLSPALAGDGEARFRTDGTLADLPLPAVHATLAQARGGVLSDAPPPPYSILPESAASELPDFGDTRVLGDATAGSQRGSGLPVIGRRPEIGRAHV